MISDRSCVSPAVASTIKTVSTATYQQQVADGMSVTVGSVFQVEPVVCFPLL